jgi:methylmalonyl-CoA/ethylmalonyl-CoA epimerase
MRSAIPFVTDILGARFLFAGDQPEVRFRWAQFAFPGGGKLELVTPLGDGFVSRFLDRRGEGVHHLTLKVPDIGSALERLREAGTPVFGVAIERVGWKEAFIHPRDARGTLIQIAESPWSDEDAARHHLEPHGSDDHRHLLLQDLVGPPEAAPRP